MPLQRVTSLRRRAQANAPAASYSCRVLFQMTAGAETRRVYRARGTGRRGQSLQCISALLLYRVLCCCQQESLELASLAEETYSQLSDDVTCRASALKSLVLTSCSSDVVQLLSALCSQLLHLQLVDCNQVSRVGGPRKAVGRLRVFQGRS